MLLRKPKQDSRAFPLARLDVQLRAHELGSLSHELQAEVAAATCRYRRLVGNTGSGKKAIVGVARRLGVLLWRLSCRGEPYRAAA